MRELKEQRVRPSTFAEGRTLAATLLAEGLVDEIILKLTPVLFGSGIPLFSRVIEQTDLELADSKTHGNGVTLLRYRVRGA